MASRSAAVALVDRRARSFRGKFLGASASSRQAISVVACENRFGFVARLDQLPLGEILLGEFDRFLEHALDFRVVKP